MIWNNIKKLFGREKQETTKEAKDFKIKEWNKLSADSAKFILTQAEKNIIEHNETAKLLTTRAQTIIGFTIPVISGLTVYLFTLSSKNEAFGFLFWIPFAAVCGLLIILVLSFEVYWIYRGRPVGNEPANIVNDQKLNLPHTVQELAFMVTRIQSLQRMIADNKEQNKLRSDQLQLIYAVLVVLIAVIDILCVLFSYQL